MQAGLGANPSFVWRSLCWGRELLSKGIGWNIVNGRSIKANRRDWFSSWLVEGSSSCSIPNQLVAAYINTEEEWVEEKVQNDFVAFEAEEILNAKICKDGKQDWRYWRYHPKGKYIVKSGYHMRMEKIRAEVEGQKPSNSAKSSDWWENTWNLKVPPKLKIFWWELCLDIIATDEKLKNHHEHISPSCQLCGFNRATTIHAIFRCPFVKSVWHGYGVVVPTKRAEVDDSMQFLSDLFHLIKFKLKEDLIVIVLGIWRKRCESHV